VRSLEGGGSKAAVTLYTAAPAALVESMSPHQDLSALLRARTPLLIVESAAEHQVVDGFRHAISQSLRPLYRWSITDGLVRLDMDMDGDPPPPDTTALLEAIKRHAEPGIYLLLDFMPYLRYPMALRMLREIVLRSGVAEHTLVLVAPRVELPEDLQPHATRFELPLPGAEAIAAMLREEAFRYSREHGRRVEVDAEAARAIVRNLRGLALDDARRIARKLIQNDGALTVEDLPALAQAKHRLLDRDGLLHFEYETAAFADVAGLARLKRWVSQRRPAFIGARQPVRLDPPKGVLLLGVQGCGKSLAAKAIAGGFGVPLVRLDIGTLYNKYQGETERNLREALRNAELLAPCVLWIDEIEKGLAGDDNDAGVSRRVLGYLLTWMAERKAAVFLVATANQVDRLPAELLRKGRFDEVFFVDLPDAATREQIFAIHLRRRALRGEDFDLPALAAASEGYSGAEIEQVVVAALYAAVAEDAAPAQRHLLESVAATRPLSVLMAEPVAALRAWARERTVPAD
jgi:MoxR-like ATPase